LSPRYPHSALKHKGIDIFFTISILTPLPNVYKKSTTKYAAIAIPPKGSVARDRPEAVFFFSE